MFTKMNKKMAFVFVLKSVLYLALLFNTNKIFSQEKYLNDKYLIVLDVQQYWTDNALPDKASQEMLKSINSLIEITNPDKVIYIKTMAVAKILSISLKGFKIDTVYADEFDKNLMIVNSTFFVKNEGNAFATTTLIDFLTQNNAKEIIVTGLLAEKCVFKTVLGGIARGYDIFVVPQAIGSKSKKRKQKVLTELQNKGCKIINFNDLNYN